MKPSIRMLIDVWHAECAEIRMSEHGTPMPIIPNSRMMESLKILAKTLLEHGYPYEEVDKTNVSVMIVDKCWKENKIRKMSLADIRKAKMNLAETWDSVLHSSEFSGITIATLSEDEKIVATEQKEYKKPEKPLEMNPKDMLKMDTSDIPDAPLDLDFIEELGLDESDFNGEKDGQ